MSHKQEEVVEYKRCESLTQSRKRTAIVVDSLIIDTTGKTTSSTNSIMSPATAAAAKSQQGNKIQKWVPSIINSFPSSPSLAVLERTSFTVTNESVETIIFRSTECLRLRSIKATYYENAIVRCETSNKTIFEIHLFRGEGEGEGEKEEGEEKEKALSVQEQKPSITKEEDSIVLLVEIQLRSGDCMEFHDEYIALRESILNDNLPRIQTEEELMKEEERDPEEELRMILKEKYIPISDGVIERNVQRVAKNITSSTTTSIDDILFSFKELRLLTKVPSSSRRTALKASKMIMMEDEFSNIKQKIIQTITSTLNEGEDAEEIHSLALTILVNCLKALHRSNNNDDDDVDSTNMFQDVGKSVIPTLVKILNHSEDEPYLAYLATECISILMKSSTTTRQQEDIEISTIKNALIHGRDVGMESYHNLERVTTKALQTLSTI